MGRRSGKKAKRWEDQHDNDNKEENIDDFEREWMSKRRKVAVQNDEKSRQQTHPDGVGKKMLIKQSRGGNANGDSADCSAAPDASSCINSPNDKSSNINHNSPGNNKTANENDNAKETHKEKEKLKKLRLRKQLQKQRRKEKKAAAATALQATLQARQESRQQLLQQTKEFVDKKQKIRQFDATTASASTDNSSKTNKHQGFAPHPHPQNQRNHDILYQDLRIGRGPPIRHRKNTTVSYTLRAKSHSVGKVLDAGKSFSFRFGKGEVIKGWDIGLEGMRVGGVRRLIVKAGMGYGKRDVGAGRGGDLFFEVELLRVAP